MKNKSFIRRAYSRACGHGSAADTRGSVPFIKRAAIFAVAATVALSTALSVFANGYPASAETVQPLGGNYYVSDYDTRQDAQSAGSELSRTLTKEGAVLLKNADNALPLAAGSKVSLFGMNVYRQMPDIAKELRGAGYSVNPDLEKFYSAYEYKGPGYPSGTLKGLVTGEADISSFDKALSIAQYNDAAIFGIYRVGAEGSDLPRTMGTTEGDNKKYGVTSEPITGARAYDDHYYQLDAYELATLRYCTDHFDKVILVIDSPAPLELGFLDDPDHYAYSPKIKSALWFSSYTTGPVVKLISGEVNPSGHLPDTWARDFKADPTWNNFGNNFMENYEDGSGAIVYAKGNQYANDNMKVAGDKGGGFVSNYVYYKEGIYSGYRYYETRGFVEGDGEWTGTETDVLPHYAHTANEAIHYYSKTSETRVSPGNDKTDKAMQTELDGKTWSNWYDAHVVYPFGHGLSYTDFTWRLDGITDTLDTNGSITANVIVTNTGAVAGKDVVQLYYSAPYKTGEIEKVHVKLGAFAKTGLIAPGGSETVKLEFKVRDMASYDYNDANKNGFKGYELDAGTYRIYIGKNAHCWADEAVIKKSYALDAGVKYETDAATGAKIENRFDALGEQLLREDRYPEDEQNDEKDVYMSRADFAGTYPTLSYRLTAEQWIIDALKLYNNDNSAPYGSEYPEDKPTDPWYNDIMPVTGAKYDTPILLKELHGLDYDDPKWGLFLDQLTTEQLTQMVLNGNYYAGMSIPSLGIERAENRDRPEVLDFSDCTDSTGYLYKFWLSFDVCTAATWDVRLAYERGKVMGNLSLWGGKTINSRIPGWYAPAVNVHRNPFGGRNGEYFSEDGLLTGKLAAEIVIGAQEKGMYCYVKHFAINSQETNRSGLITWINEQTMREVYFTPFELCVKEGGAIGMMSSLNRLGARWAGGSYELCTEVLRNEWGFKGPIVTDTYSVWSDADVMIRAGGNLCLGNSSGLKIAPKSATTVNCLRNAVHGILYANANSMAINQYTAPVAPHRIAQFGGKTLPVAVAGSEYSYSLADCIELNTVDYPDMTISEISFALDEGQGELPDGFTLSPDGALGGVADESGTFKFRVTAKSKTDRASAYFVLTVANGDGMIIYAAQENSLVATAGAHYGARLDYAYIFVAGATDEQKAAFPAVKYALPQGEFLPDGMTLTPEGFLDGIPVKACADYRFTVIASASGYPDATCEFSMSVLKPLRFEGGRLATGGYGVDYIGKVVPATGCDGDVVYSLKDGDALPNGLQLTSGGYITGKPMETGAFEFTVIASGGATTVPAEAKYGLTVEPVFATPIVLPLAVEGEEFVAAVNTALGAFGANYTVVGGVLPQNVELSGDGTLSGTPLKAGIYSFVVRCDVDGLCDETMVSLYVADAETADTAVKASDGTNAAVIALSVCCGVLFAGLAALGTLNVLVFVRKKRAGAGGGIADESERGAGENVDNDRATGSVGDKGDIS